MRTIPASGGGVSFTDSAGLAALLSDESGTGVIILSNGATITTPVIAGLTASGSTSNDFSGSTGTFKTSTGANTLGGAVTINDATTPSITTASGKTNTGFVTVSGKTSGSLKITTADATAQAVTVSAAAQTSGASTITIPDMAGVSDTLVFLAKAQTLTNKTLTSPTLTSPALGTVASGDISACTGKGTALIVVSDQKTQNTQGGTFTSGAWRTRDINKENVDTGNNCSISSNQITLAAGTYRCHIRCPAMNCAAHQAKLYNVTDTADLSDVTGDVCYGTSEYTSNSGTFFTLSYSIITRRFTLAAQKTLEIRHQCQTTEATNGFGTAANFGPEIYTVAVFEKE